MGCNLGRSQKFLPKGTPEGIYIYTYKLSEIILSRLEIMNFIVYSLFFLIQRDVYYGIIILNSF